MAAQLTQRSGRVLSRALSMDSSSYKFFTRSTFSSNQDTTTGRGDSSDPFLEFEHRFALPDHVIEHGILRCDKIMVRLKGDLRLSSDQGGAKDAAGRHGKIEVMLFELFIFTVGMDGSDRFSIL